MVELNGLLASRHHRLPAFLGDARPFDAQMPAQVGLLHGQVDEEIILEKLKIGGLFERLNVEGFAYSV